MAERKGFIIQENVDLAFESMGKQYKLSINLDSGLLLLREGTQLELKQVTFLGEQESYTGENVSREVADEPIGESLEEVGTTNIPQQEKPVKRHKKKKRK